MSEFGLTNAPATFQSVMNDVLGDFLVQFVLVYLDNTVLISKSEAEHLQHLEQIFQLLCKHKLHAKLLKCKFA